MWFYVQELAGFEQVSLVFSNETDTVLITQQTVSNFGHRKFFENVLPCKSQT